MHAHVLVLDGVFTAAESGEVTFHALPAPSDREICELLGTVRERVLRHLRRHGWLAEAADDVDGCSASCQPDDDSRTPGDDRAGYVSCDSASSGHSSTCGPGLGCCPDPTNVPEGPVCGATRADCGFLMAFIVLCDGPEDCSAGTPCSATRTGQICDSGYYGVCHKNSDCPDGQACDTNGECRAPASGP